MKKINNNNRFRNNNNNGNSIYSLNYKFDSISSAGKYTGTALDLIKRYNELAKEAQSRGDYVDMEVFRQYAEHYRKIVTEINARKNQVKDNTAQTQVTEAENTAEEQNSTLQNAESDNMLASQNESEQKSEEQPAEKTPRARRLKRGFTVVEVNKDEENTATGANENNKTPENVETAPISEEEKPKKRRVLKRKVEEANA